MSRLPRVLFILKLRQHCGGEYSVLKHSGLFNSASFVKDLLARHGYEVKLVQVVDNNAIDREVTEFRPDIVVVEALWVVPDKFPLLRKLHPKVKWVVRMHSELPFLANEGVALEWVNQYIEQPNVYVSANSPRAHHDLVRYVQTKASWLGTKLIYLPNYYPVGTTARTTKAFFTKGDALDVGCFGAIRPMKNHLLQAAAAVQFAEKHGLRCRFHVNAGRVEQKGEVVLKNLRAFFDGLKGKHELVEHGWLDRDEFLALVRTMHIGLQVSFSETFNIVSADFVGQDVPIVTSSEVSWMPNVFTASPTDTVSIVRSMEMAMLYDRHWSWLEWPRKALRKVVERSAHIWVQALQIL